MREWEVTNTKGAQSDTEVRSWLSDGDGGRGGGGGCGGEVCLMTERQVLVASMSPLVYKNNNYGLQENSGTIESANVVDGFAYQKLPYCEVEEEAFSPTTASKDARADSVLCTDVQGNDQPSKVAAPVSDLQDTDKVNSEWVASDRSSSRQSKRKPRKKSFLSVIRIQCPQVISSQDSKGDTSNANFKSPESSEKPHLVRSHKQHYKPVKLQIDSPILLDDNAQDENLSDIDVQAEMERNRRHHHQRQRQRQRQQQGELPVVLTVRSNRASNGHAESVVSKTPETPGARKDSNTLVSHRRELVERRLPAYSPDDDSDVEMQLEGKSKSSRRLADQNIFLRPSSSPQAAKEHAKSKGLEECDEVLYTKRPPEVPLRMKRAKKQPVDAVDNGSTDMLRSDERYGRTNDCAHDGRTSLDGHRSSLHHTVNLKNGLADETESILLRRDSDSSESRSSRSHHEFTNAGRAISPQLHRKGHAVETSTVPRPGDKSSSSGHHRAESSRHHTANRPPDSPVRSRNHNSVPSEGFDGHLNSKRPKNKPSLEDHQLPKNLHEEDRRRSCDSPPVTTRSESQHQRHSGNYQKAPKGTL
ncbi:unnamed protein product [Dibothriocephalus latus]|uniref:Uncharacterized protein n=1 Tax=Dibothriocephalus latus TaxID=60516 RepID=A0A3P6SLZ5_DIBLA|nr:unnamed protein product [Dibothriocephalus latus]